MFFFLWNFKKFYQQYKMQQETPLSAIDLIMKRHEVVSKEKIKIEKWSKQKREEMLQLFEQLVLYSNDHTKVIPVFIPIYKQAIAHDNTILLSVINILARIFFNHISIVKPNLFPQFFHAITYYKNNFSTYALYISAITESDRTNIIYQLEKIFLTKKGRDIAEKNYDYELASYPIENIVPIIDLCKEKCVKGDFDAISSIYFLKRYYKKYYNDYIKYLYVGTGVEVYDKKFLLLNISKYAYVLEPIDAIPLFFILINLYGIHVVGESEDLIQNVFEKFDDSVLYEDCNERKYPSYETMIYQALSFDDKPVSIYTIKKYILQNYNITKEKLDTWLLMTLKRLVRNGSLVKPTKLSYLLSKTFVPPVEKCEPEVDLSTYTKYIKPKTPHVITFKNEEFTAITNKIAEES
jgi:hypothetical protein